MARTETSNFSHPSASATTTASNLASSVIPRSNPNQTKDHVQRSDIVKTEFHAREGTYKISAVIDNLSKTGTSTCLSEPVQVTLLTRLQTISNSNSETSSRRSSIANNHHHHNSLTTTNCLDNHSNDQRRSPPSTAIEINQANGNVMITEILAFNIGRELIIYEFAEATQVDCERFFERNF